jgi:chromatin assembly factor 1 subunit B
MSSSDGFCSSLTFAAGELGEKYTGPLATQTKHHHTPSSINTAASQSQSQSNHTTPTPTPTAPSHPVTSTTTTSSHQKTPSAGFPASPSSFIPARPGSPARSNSVSSIATSSSFAQGPGDQSNMNAPTPAMSSIPGLAAANSGPVGAMPMWTPPLTPAHGHGGTHSASSSVSGIPGTGVGRRESESEREDGVSGSKKRDLHAVYEVEETREGKRRRITPTPVTIGGSVDGGESAMLSTGENTPTTQTPTQQ